LSNGRSRERGARLTPITLERGRRLAPLRAAVCFVGSQWGWFTKPFDMHGVLVAWPDRLGERIREAGRLDPDTVEWTAAHLAVALPAA
jgi:hypothetical protein